MEKVVVYRDIIHRLLREYRDFLVRQTKTPVETEIICDDANGQYMVMRIGWRGETRVRRALFYLRLKDGKIWIEEDWTKESIAEELIRAGVPCEDIVLAFHAPNLRLKTELTLV